MDDLLRLSFLFLGLIDFLLHDQEILLLFQLSLTALQSFKLILDDLKSSGSTSQLLMQNSHLIIIVFVALHRFLLEKNHVFVDEFVEFIIEPSDHVPDLLVELGQSINIHLAKPVLVIGETPLHLKDVFVGGEISVILFGDSAGANVAPGVVGLETLPGEAPLDGFGRLPPFDSLL